MLAGAALSDRTGHRFRYILPGCLLMVAGFLGCGLSRAPAIAIPALALVVVGLYVMQGPLWAISTAFLTGRSQAAGIAAMNTIGIVGGFAGPYWMGFAKDLTGNDQRGLLTMTAPMLAATAIMLYLRHQAKSPGKLETVAG
jgi:ACS family tartrate transporter-like MFS transporter